jgi:hypothetical protein
MTVALPLHQEMIVLKRYTDHSFCHVVSTLVLCWDWKDFKESLVVGVPEVVILHMDVPGAACGVVSHHQQVSSIVVFENSCMYHRSDLLQHRKQLNKFQDKTADGLDGTEGLGQRIICSKGGAQADLLNELGFPDKRYSAKSDDTSKAQLGAGSAQSWHQRNNKSRGFQLAWQ